MEKIKPVLILSGILALLLILLLVTGETDKEEERRVDPLITLDTDNISSLSITAGTRPAVLFIKTGDKWTIEEPLYSLASDETMQAVMETLDKLVGIPIEVDKTLVPGEFGLEGGEAITVTAVSKDGQEESFTLGKQIPLDVGYVYTYVPSSNSYYKAFKDAREVFSLPLTEYRDKTLVDLPVNSIERIELSGSMTGEMSPVVLQKMAPWWELTAPKDAPGHNGKVKTLIEGILSLRANDFPDPDKSALPEEPELTIKFITSDGSTREVSFSGSYGDELQYASSDIIPYVLGIPAGIVDKLPVHFNDLRSRAVLRFDPDSIQDIRIESETEDFSLKKTESGWRISSEEELPVDEALVKQLVNLLILTDIDDFPETFQPHRDDTEIQLRVILTDKNGEKHSLELGKALDGGIVPGFSSFRDRPFMIPADFSVPFNIDRDYFEDKYLLAFNSRNVGSVDIQWENGKITLEKTGSDWLLTEPERVAADAPKSWGIVFALEKLVYVKKAEAGKFQENGYDIDKPDYRIRIHDSDGNEQGSLDLWIDVKKAQIFATSTARKGIFLIDEKLLDTIPKDHTDLIYRR